MGHGENKRNNFYIEKKIYTFKKYTLSDPLFIRNNFKKHTDKRTLFF
jgi:hypothetical protein